MKNEISTIRLIYPQWQGGDVSSLLPDFSEEESSTGYYIGAYLLNFLAPKTNQKILKVPVVEEYEKRKIQDGITDRDVILKQTNAAIQILEQEQPDKIVTLGGECSVSVVPFSYLAHKYQNDVAVILIDAHPDITLPGDTYTGYHAMAVTALMGEGDKKIVSLLPEKIKASNILLAGIRDWERDEIKIRQKTYGLKHLSPQDIRIDVDAVTNWISTTGAKKVLIHFDMDVLEPSEIIPAVGICPDGLKIEETLELINKIAESYDIVGLTIAEPMPRIALKLKRMMQQLPLLN